MANILITGAAGGLGLAVCKEFLNQGHKVLALDIKEPEFSHRNLRYFPVDVRSPEDVERVKSEVSEVTSHIDVLLNMAGIYIMDAYSELSEEDMNSMLSVNLLGAWRINKAFLPLLDQSSRIIVVTSELDGQSALPFNGLYTMTKTALGSYTDSLRAELALLGIKVIKVKPGAFATSMVSASFKSMERVRQKTVLFKKFAHRFQSTMEKMGGKPGKPEVLARKLLKISMAKRPKACYSIRVGVLLKIYDILPKSVAVWFLKLILQR